MNLVKTYGPELPFLRRLSRALTGSQETGDTYVRATLEALTADSGSIDTHLEPRIGLYKMFLGIWNSSGAQLEAQLEEYSPTTDRVRQLTPLPRQAFLLQSLEGFEESEIATIMGLSIDDVLSLITDAEAEIDKELRTNVLIIEDEAFIAADIEGLVAELGHQVDNIVATHGAAVAAVKQKKPGLILADIQLADGSSGIDAVAEILKEHNIPVIFITAFPERLLTGDKPEPAYLITKPFQPANVKAAISQALFFHDKD